MTKHISRKKWSARISVELICFLALFMVLVARNPAWEMLWDAQGYMLTSSYWLSAVPHEQIAEQLHIRGILTSFIYLIPTFLGNNFLKTSQFGTYTFVFVMVQNAILISWMCAYVFPKITGLLGPKNSLTVVTTSLLGFYALNSFVPYSLMDLWALAFLMPVVYLIHSKSRTTLATCGLLLGVCLNLRPSYIFAIILLIVSAFVINRASLFLLTPSLFLASIPQMIYNYKWYESFSMFPKGLGSISSYLAQFASYYIRYDTIAYRPPSLGGLSFCDKTMKEIAFKVKPESTLDTVLVLLLNPDHSAFFLIKKLASAFWWPVTVPYYEHNPIVNSVYGAVLLFIVTFGLSKILRNFISSDQKKQYLGVFAIATGFCCTLILYTNETRYGASVVILAICGVALYATQFKIEFGRIVVGGQLNGQIAGTFAVYTILTLVAVFTLVGDFGFQSISNCG